MASYAERRKEIRDGDLLFFRESGLAPWLIKRATHGIYAHCGVAAHIYGRLMILESRALQGVTMRRLSQFLPVDWVATGCEWTEEMGRLALEHFQEPYSWSAALDLAIHVKPAAKALVCSLYASDVLAPWLAKTGTVLDRTDLSPTHLHDIFVNDRTGRTTVTLE